MKDSRIEKPKPKSQDQKPSARQRSDSAETSEQAWKEKKKKAKRERRNRERRPQDITLATEVNITNILGGHCSGGGGQGGRSQKDLAQAICYNCNKKGHFARKCLEPLKPKN